MEDVQGLLDSAHFFDCFLNKHYLFSTLNFRNL